MPREIYAVVLAAGLSRRYGRAKLLDKLHGTPLLRYALTAAQGSCPGNVVLVTGHAPEEIADAASGLADAVVMNTDYRTGMGSSIAAGVSHLPEDAAAVMIMLADQPLVTATYISQLLDRWHGDPDAIVASRYSGINGPPVLFGRSHFAQLSELEGDAGARQILHACRDSILLVEFEAAAIDIDTPGDLEALLSRR